MIREMAKNLGVSDKGSKLDIINRIKSALNIEGTFLTPGRHWNTILHIHIFGSVHAM